VRLTRRDAVKSLALGGLAGTGTVATSEFVVDDGPTGSPELAPQDVKTLRSVAEVVYPSAVEVTVGFLETSFRSLPAQRRAALSGTIEELNDYTRARYGDPFYGVTSVSTRDAILRSMGVNRAPSDPDGTVPQRVRYHLVNTLLYVLFSHPRGSTLAGIDSPVGHPGGFATYRGTDSSAQHVEHRQHEEASQRDEY
jgi:hypothetical protein